MQLSIAPLIISILLTQRFINFAKIENHQKWVRLFRYAKYFAIFLFLAEVILNASGTVRWIWHFYFIALIVFAVKQKEMRALQMYILAFIPYVIVAFLSNATELISNDFYNKWNNYFDIAKTLSFMWLVAILFSQHRQNKAAEKDRLERQQQDEINRAIALRKVELEGLVAERTAELSKQKEELEHTLSELRTSQTQLIHAEKMASLGELTAGIAHEIQNPLNFVNNFSEVSKELLDEMNEELANGNLQFASEISEDIKSNLEKILHHGKRADAIVKGMLQHSRTSTGQKEPTDINALADEYLRLAYHGLRAKDKSFNAIMKTEFDDQIGKINVIPQDIGRVILNLITNAFYAVNEKKKQVTNPAVEDLGNDQTTYEPTVTVKTAVIPSAKNKKSCVSISVSDNGNGIPKSALEKIFQPFFTTKPSGQGTGLGLSISYEIITKAHNGQLKVENNETGGATFTIIIPF
jgi:signal transduction histidine kinase